MHCIFLLIELCIMTKKSEKQSLSIRFLGTGTSQGIPVIGCKCNVCNFADEKNRRLRTSVFFSYKGYDFVIDAGPDFRQQMLMNSIENVDAIFLTHEHKDHIAGLDDIRPFNFAKQKPMDIYAEQRVIDSVKQEFSYVFKDDPYPGVPLMNVHAISDSEFSYESVCVQPIRVFHWNLPIYGFRIESFAYITDASQIPPTSMDMLQNLDVLVINALRIKKHYSHFNLDEALAVIAAVKPKRAYLTHISHLLGDHVEVQNMLPSQVFLAYDGLEIMV